MRMIEVAPDRSKETKEERIAELKRDLAYQLKNAETIRNGGEAPMSIMFPTAKSWEACAENTKKEIDRISGLIE